MKFSDLKHSNIFQVISSFLVCILIASILTPSLDEAREFEVSQTDIQYYEALPNLTVRRPRVQEVDQRANFQYSEKQMAGRQFSFLLSQNEVGHKETLLFLPIVNGPALAFFNGVQIGKGQSSMAWNFGSFSQSLEVQIPKEYYHPGANRIDIIVAENSSHTGVPIFILGEATQISPISTAFDRWQSRLAFVAIGCGILLLFVSLFGALIAPQGRLFYLVALAMLIVITPFVFEASSLPGGKTAAFAKGLQFAFVFGIGAYIFWQTKRLPYRGLIVGGALFAVIAFIYVLSYIALPTRAAYPISAITLSILWPLPFYLIATVIIASTSYLERQAQFNNAKLDVIDARNALSESERKLTAEIENRVLYEERQRIMRDVHDGFGGNLLSLLLKVRSETTTMETVEEEIQNSLHDLRLVVDALDHAGEKLTPALMTFRSRAQNILSGSSIELIWKQEEDLNAQFDDPRIVLNIYRFLQEALSNIIRHANAKVATISISKDMETGSLVFSVSDDGRGLTEKTNYSGKGMSNLRVRAEAVDGSLYIGPNIDENGTLVRLSIPFGATASLQNQ